MPQVRAQSKKHKLSIWDSGVTVQVQKPSSANAAWPRITRMIFSSAKARVLQQLSALSEDTSLRSEHCDSSSSSTWQLVPSDWRPFCRPFLQPSILGRQNMKKMRSLGRGCWPGEGKQPAVMVTSYTKPLMVHRRTRPAVSFKSLKERQSMEKGENTLMKPPLCVGLC